MDYPQCIMPLLSKYTYNCMVEGIVLLAKGLFLVLGYLDQLGEFRGTYADSNSTTISLILNQFEKSCDYYHINPKKGCPCKMDLCESCIATRMIAWVEAVNTTEVQKKAFPMVC
jgi:hypothetical protein